VVGDFHQAVWSGWLSDTQPQNEQSDNCQRDESHGLNWNNFEFDDNPPGDREWNRNQPWPLIDENRFYYPLFGLGNTEAELLIVGAGPAYNDRSIWQELTSESGREVIHGPPDAFTVWKNQSMAQNAYKSRFESQRRFWAGVREIRSNTLVSNLKKILCQYENEARRRSVLNKCYFTNLMKDGEFTGSGYNLRGTEFDRLHDLEQRDEYEYCLPGLDMRPADQMIPPDNDWPRLTNTSKRNKRGFIDSYCKLASREFWLPFLAKEIELVNPEMILALGRTATHAVYEIHGNDWLSGQKIREEKLCDAADGSGRSILPSAHWSYSNWNPKNISKNIDKIL
jgi:uracil-DNA glycosylase